MVPDQAGLGLLDAPEWASTIHPEQRMNQPIAPASLSEILATFAEPTRLRILRVLDREELSVGEAAKVVQLPQSTVSRHLKLLADAGLLVRRSVGTATLYRLLVDDLPEHARPLWLTLRAHVVGTPDAAEDFRRLASVLAERRVDSQAFFGRVAGEWDSLRTKLFGDGFTAKALLSLCDPRWVVADLGCGTGNAAELLAPHVQRVIAIDQSEPMLDAARKRLAGVANIEFIASGLDRLPLQDGAADVVIAALVLHHLQEPAAALREMKRVLRRGGVVVVIDMLAHTRQEYRTTMGHVHLGFAPEALTALFVEAGLPAPRVVELPVDAEGRGPALFVATARGG